jgi:hypothetical protein
MFEHEAGVIRRLMRDQIRIVYSDHAERARMVQRQITDGDVRTVLGKCRVTDIRPHKLGPVWSAEGTDLDGRRLRVCVSVPPAQTAIIVVTTIDLDAKD